MRRSKLVSTTMALSLAMVVSNAMTGCSSKANKSDAPVSTVEEVITTEVESSVETTSEEEVEKVYEVIPVAVPYSVLVSSDTMIMDNPDIAAKIVDLPKDTQITIIGDVSYGGVETHFYYAQLTAEDGNTVEGYVDGTYIDFNSKVVDSMEGYSEIEGGDGEDTTDTTDVAQAILNVEEVEPYTMYASTACNVRIDPSKESELIGTLEKDEEVTVIGKTGDWSRIDYQTVYGYVKSSLLSDKKTASAKKTETPKSDSQPAQTETPKPSGDTAQTTPPSQPKQSGGKITAVDPEMGYQITMTPVGDGSGFYKDQYGEFRDAQGNLVYYNYATGEYSTDSSHAQMEVSETDLSGDLKQGSGMQFQ